MKQTKASCCVGQAWHLICLQHYNSTCMAYDVMCSHFPTLVWYNLFTQVSVLGRLCQPKVSVIRQVSDIRESDTLTAFFMQRAQISHRFTFSTCLSVYWTWQFLYFLNERLCWLAHCIYWTRCALSKCAQGHQARINDIYCWVPRCAQRHQVRSVATCRKVDHWSSFVFKFNVLSADKWCWNFLSAFSFSSPLRLRRRVTVLIRCYL